MRSIASVCGVFWSSDFPVRRTLLGEIAGAQRLSRAMALESATNNATRMVGPALGGVLIGTLGLLGVYLVGALLYAICVLMIVRLPYRSASAKTALNEDANIYLVVDEGGRTIGTGSRQVCEVLAKLSSRSNATTSTRTLPTTLERENIRSAIKV